MTLISKNSIHFVGDWSAAQRRRLREALRVFEDAWQASERPPTELEPFWILVQETPPWGPYYFAHRLGTTDSLTAQTPEDLIAVLETSAQEL
jgi:hypothetical protein